MHHLTAHNERNESSIHLVADKVTKHASLEEFYVAVIQFLGDAWVSSEVIDEYIRNAKPVPRTVADLQGKAEECLASTSIPGFSFKLTVPTEIHSFQDDWNLVEFVWVSNSQYWFMGWDTTA